MPYARERVFAQLVGGKPLPTPKERWQQIFRLINRDHRRKVMTRFAPNGSPVICDSVRDSMKALDGWYFDLIKALNVRFPNQEVICDPAE